MTISEIEEQSVEGEIATPQSVNPNLVTRPWRRYLARMLDLSIYETAWLAFLALALRMNLATQVRSPLGTLLNQIVALFIMLFLEPLLLNILGTTFGKWILGLRIETAAGGKPGYGEGLARTWALLRDGFAFGIPIASLIMMWQSFKRAKNREPQPWDANLVQKVRDTRWYRGIAYAIMHVLLIGIVVTLALVGIVPPNRGELTIAEFAENYNAMADFLGAPYYRLNTEGQWMIVKPNDGRYFDDDFYPHPEMAYTIENDHIKAIRWQASVDGVYEPIYSRDAQLTLAALSFVGAQKNVGLYSTIRNELFNLVTSHRFKRFSVTRANVALEYNIEYSGYAIIGKNDHLFPEKRNENRFHEEFIMEKVA